MSGGHTTIITFVTNKGILKDASISMGLDVSKFPSAYDVIGSKVFTARALEGPAFIAIISAVC